MLIFHDYGDESGVRDLDSSSEYGGEEEWVKAHTTEMVVQGQVTYSEQIHCYVFSYNIIWRWERQLFSNLHNRISEIFKSDIRIGT